LLNRAFVAQTFSLCTEIKQIRVTFVGVSFWTMKRESCAGPQPADIFGGCKMIVTCTILGV